MGDLTLTSRASFSTPPAPAAAAGHADSSSTSGGSCLLRLVMSQSVFLLAALVFGADVGAAASAFLAGEAAGGDTAGWGARTGASTSIGCLSITAKGARQARSKSGGDGERKRGGERRWRRRSGDWELLGGGRGVGDGSGVAQRLVGTWEATAIWQGRSRARGTAHRSNRSGGCRDRTARDDPLEQDQRLWFNWIMWP